MNRMPMDAITNPMLDHQIQLETLFNKNQLMPRIMREFTECKEFDFKAYMEQKGIKPEFGFALLTQMVLHKRTTLSTLVGILRRHFEPSPSASQLAADMLLVAAEADLVDYDPQFEQFIVKLNITQDVQDELDKYQFPLPMVAEPKKLTTNKSSAYHSLKDGSVILRNNHHDEDVCLDHLNRANKIKFSIDMNVATMVRNQWRNLDKPKQGETRQDFDKRRRAFEKFDRTSREVIGTLVGLGNEFHLTHKYDKRGRVYCQGYHVSYQGAAWNKAVIMLADEHKEIIP